MIPTAIVCLPKLPLTPNGKVDRRALPNSSAAQRPSVQEVVLPRNALEKQLQDIWSAVLGLEQISIFDDFFDLGGDSILSLQVMARADEQGVRLSVKDLLDAPTIAGLASRLETQEYAAHFARNAPRYLLSAPETGASDEVGLCPLSPIQQWFFARALADHNHFNQAFVFAAQRRLEPHLLQQTLTAMVTRHDALRLRFAQSDGIWTQAYVAADAGGAAPLFEVVTLHDLAEDAVRATIVAHAEQAHRRFDITHGPVMAAILFEPGQAHAQWLWIGIHHLVVDGVSWRILVDDLATIYEQLAAGSEIQFSRKSWSFRRYVHALTVFAAHEASTVVGDWQARLEVPSAALRTDRPAGPGTVATQQTTSVFLAPELTGDLLHRARRAYGTEVNVILLTALHAALAAWQEQDAFTIWLKDMGVKRYKTIWT